MKYMMKEPSGIGEYNEHLEFEWNILISKYDQSQKRIIECIYWFARW